MEHFRLRVRHEPKRGHIWELHLFPEYPRRQLREAKGLRPTPTQSRQGPDSRAKEARPVLDLASGSARKRPGRLCLRCLTVSSLPAGAIRFYPLRRRMGVDW